ncbi:MAG: CoA transferase [Myxococcota bacterium]|nr:CoA transferase [Myxococcota bacterium]
MAHPNLPHGPLTGIKVIDFSRVLAGPYCSMTLGDFGADVIKVERVDGGDDTRRFGPPFLNGVSTYFLAINRNKRSIALDLKSDEGLAVARKLIADADILLENFRPGTMDKLGLGLDTCLELNDRLIYCSISAFGHEGHPDWTRRPGYDLILQGMGGIPSITGPTDGAPSKVGASIADVVSGMNAVTGILAALHAREQTGRGQLVDTSMLDGQVGLLTYLATAYLNTGREPPRMGNRHLSIAPYSTFQAADGWLNIAVANERLWHTFCRALGREELASDPRFISNVERTQNVDALDSEIEATLITKSVADWVEHFDRFGIPAGPVLGIADVLEHPQLKARGMIASSHHPTAGAIKMTGVVHRLSDTPGTIRREPPVFGAHTTEVLKELGYTDEQAAALVSAGVAAQGEKTETP